MRRTVKERAAGLARPRGKGSPLAGGAAGSLIVGRAGWGRVPPRRAQLTTASNLAFIFLIVTIVVAFVVLVVSGLVAAAFGRRRVRSSEMLGAS